MSLKQLFVVEAVYGILAELLDVDIDTARCLLDGYSRRSGRPAGELALAVVEGSLAIAWVDKKDASRGPDVPAVVLDVLYIENQEHNITLMRRLFGQWPTMHLDTTGTGGAGLDHIRLHRPDVVLLDGNLPDLDGTEVLRRIREDPATADLPVIVVSGDSSPDRVSALLAAGANEYLTKPLDFDHLEATITALTTAAVRSVRRSEQS